MNLDTLLKQIQGRVHQATFTATHDQGTANEAAEMVAGQCRADLHVHIEEQAIKLAIEYLSKQGSLQACLDRAAGWCLNQEDPDVALGEAEAGPEWLAGYRECFRRVLASLTPASDQPAPSGDHVRDTRCGEDLGSCCSTTTYPHTGGDCDSHNFLERI